MTISEVVSKFCELYGMSGREREVLLLAASGYTNRGIGKALGIQMGTVSTYWRRIYQRTGAPDRSSCCSKLLQFAASGVSVESNGRYACFCGAVVGTALDVGKRCSACTSLVFDKYTRNGGDS